MQVIVLLVVMAALLFAAFWYGLRVGVRLRGSKENGAPQEIPAPPVVSVIQDIIEARKDKEYDDSKPKHMYD